MSATSAAIRVDAIERKGLVDCESTPYSPTMTVVESAATTKITQGGVPMNTCKPDRAFRWSSLARVTGAIVCLFVSSAASAQTIYKCVDSQKRIAFQQTPCQSGQRESEVAIKPAPPPPPPSPTPRWQQHSLSAEEIAAVRLTLGIAPTAAPAQARPVVQSWECTTVTGEVFYTHSRCPQWITDGPLGMRGAIPHESGVTGKPIPRALACRNMRAGGRFASRLDEQTSTYDRNLGRDPCKNY